MQTRTPIEHNENRDIAAAILQIAISTIESEASFRSTAKSYAQQFEPSSIQRLKGYFHRPPPKPGNLKDSYNGLGQWMRVCQNSIFELVYNLREAALPFLRDIAFGEYDWTQGNALEILIRLAAEGIETEQIIAELNEELPHIRYEAYLYALHPLLKLANTNPAINAILDQLTCSGFQWTINDLKKSRGE